jgi:hypothetical protein
MLAANVATERHPLALVRSTGVDTAAPAPEVLPEPWGPVVAAVGAAVGAAAKAPPSGPMGPWGPVAALVITALFGAMSWLGVQIAALRGDVAAIREDMDASIEVLDRRVDDTQAALVSAQEIAIDERRWNQKMLLDLYRATFPNREPPPVPNSESAERRILLLGR